MRSINVLLLIISASALRRSGKRQTGHQLGAATNQASSLSAKAVTYKVAIVELPAFADRKIDTRKAKNVERSVEFAGQAAAQGAQLIVLPEGGITGWGVSTRNAFRTVLEQIPEPVSDVPCDQAARYSDAPSIVTLSCGARQHGIAILASMGDEISCQGANASYPGCESSSDRRLQFNTAVLFDTDGSFVAKYHKHNLWGEDAYTDNPQDCKKSVVTLSFGVTFGLIICADAIHGYPMEEMIRDGVKNFLTPIAWDNSMATMQAMAWHQGLSLRHCVNIAASNHPWTGSAPSTGSGVFSCGRALATYYAPSDEPGPIIIREVEADPQPVAQSLLQASSEVDAAKAEVRAKKAAWAQAAGHTRASSEVDAAKAEVRAKKAAWAQAAGHTRVSSRPDFALEPLAGVANNLNWQFARLSAGRVCSGSICCVASSFSGSTSGYAVAVLDGMDSGCGMSSCSAPSLNWPAQVCAVFACSSPGASCLAGFANPGDLTGVRLDMVTSVGTTVTPMVTASGVDPSCADNPDFLDEQAGSPQWEGSCRDWIGSDCTRARQDWGYSQQGQADILANCPAACGLCTPQGALQALVEPGAGLYFSTNGTAAALQVSSADPLVSALLYGRRMGPENGEVLPYNCPVGK